MAQVLIFKRKIVFGAFFVPQRRFFSSPCELYFLVVSQIGNFLFQVLDSSCFGCSVNGQENCSFANALILALRAVQDFPNVFGAGKTLRLFHTKVAQGVYVETLTQRSGVHHQDESSGSNGAVKKLCLLKQIHRRINRNRDSTEDSDTQ